MTRPLRIPLVILCALALAGFAAACASRPATLPTAAGLVSTEINWAALTTTPQPAATTLPTATATPAAKPGQPAQAKASPTPPSPTRTPFVVLDAPPVAPITPAAGALDPARAANLRIVAELGQGEIGGVAWSPGGKILAVSAGGRVLLYDAATFNLTAALTTGPGAGLLAFNPAGDRLAVVRVNGGGPRTAPGGLPLPGDAIQVWDWAARRMVRELFLAPSDLAPDERAPDGRPDARFRVEQLAYGAGEVVAANLRNLDDPNDLERASAAWRVEDGSLIFSSIFEDTTRYDTLDFSPDGKLLVHAAGFGYVIRDTSTGQVLSGHPDLTGKVKFSPDGQSLYYLKPSEDAASGVTAYALSQAALPDDGMALPAGAPGFSGAPGAPILDLARVRGTMVALSNDCSAAHRLDLWIIDPAGAGAIDTPIADRAAHKKLGGWSGGDCDSVAIRADGKQAAIIDGQSVAVWDLDRPALITTISLSAFDPASIGMRQEAGGAQGGAQGAKQYLAVASRAAAGGRVIAPVSVWDLLSGKLLAPTHATGLTALRPGGDIVAWTGGMGDLTLWDWTTNRVLASLPAPADGSSNGIPSFMGSPFRPNLDLQFSPDGTRLDRLNLATGQALTWNGPDQPYPGARYGQFSADGHWLTWSDPGPWDGPRWWLVRRDWVTQTVREYEFPTRACCGWLEAAQESRDNDHIAGDEERVAAGGVSGTLYVWDASAPNLPLREIASAHVPIALFRNHNFTEKNAFRSLVFSPNSRLLLTTGWDGFTRLWDPATGRLLFELAGCTQADFTPDGKYLVTQASGVIWVWGE